MMLSPILLLSSDYGKIFLIVEQLCVQISYGVTIADLTSLPKAGQLNRKYCRQISFAKTQQRSSDEV